jgi:hypothetical protein
MPSLSLGLSLESMTPISGSVIVSPTIPTSTTSISIGGIFEQNNYIDLATYPVVLTKVGTDWGIANGAGGNPHPCSFYLYHSSTNWGIIAQQFGEEGFGTVGLCQVTYANTEIPKTGWSNTSSVTGTLIINAV